MHVIIQMHAYCQLVEVNLCTGFKKNNEVSRAQEEVKKLQDRLQKLVDEFPLVETSRHANHVEHSNVSVISEPNSHSFQIFFLEIDIKILDLWVHWMDWGSFWSNM